ncbi:MAG: flagellar export chaperone FliS [Gammaproteobacteria bacterium]|nr:MAG: flagellar export chaperone FliS [Gammaproteobacteria bacterium]
MNQAAMKQYQTIGVQSGVTDASSHQLISMLMAGALDRMASARGAIIRGEISRKGELLSEIIAIIDSLRASLDHSRGGEISTNLTSLYDYIEQCLLRANLDSDVEPLDEVSSLLAEIKAGWELIPVDARRA